jgi:hypothetical protein
MTAVMQMVVSTLQVSEGGEDTRKCQSHGAIASTEGHGATTGRVVVVVIVVVTFAQASGSGWLSVGLGLGGAGCLGGAGRGRCVGFWRVLGTARMVGSAAVGTSAVPKATVFYTLGAPFSALEVGHCLGILGEVGRDAVIADAGKREVLLWAAVSILHTRREERLNDK